MSMTRRQERLQLVDESPVLDDWAGTAAQADKNALYAALFTIADGEQSPSTPVERRAGVAVSVRPGLVVHLTFPRPGAFDVLAIEAAPQPNR